VKINLLAELTRPTAETSFRLYLQGELGRRCAANRHYSMRAFAKFLNLDHATLSQCLRGKRRLTPRMIVKMGTRLGMAREALDRYIAGEEPHQKEHPESIILGEIQQLAQDASSLVSEWHHYAILELTHLQSFRPESRWIARVLGLTCDQVNVAVSRLIRLGLLEMVTRSRWIDKSGDSTLSLSDFAQVSLDRLAEMARKLMNQALESGRASHCMHTSMTFALPLSQLRAVQQRINRLHMDLAVLAQCEQACDDVFRLEINFVSVTNLNQHKGSNDGKSGHAMADPGKKPG
jgi:uncharacterized protein (TIGR02147 family)